VVIVSLIDILVLLLIFFTVTTTFKQDQPAVEIKLPDSKTAATTEQKDIPLIVYVTAKDEIFLDKEPVSADDLASKLAQLKQTKPSFKLALKADQKASFGVIIRVLDAFKTLGIQNVPAFTAPNTSNGGVHAE